MNDPTASAKQLLDRLVSLVEETMTLVRAMEKHQESIMLAHLSLIKSFVNANGIEALDPPTRVFYEQAVKIENTSEETLRQMFEALRH